MFLSEGDIDQALQNFLFVESWILVPQKKWFALSHFDITAEGGTKSNFTKSKIHSAVTLK